MRKKLLLLFFIFIVLLLFPAYAQWYQEGHAGTTSGGSSYTLFGNNLANTRASSTYEKCSIIGSLFEPVVFDKDNDDQQDIVISVANGLRFYTSNCVLEETVSFPASISTMPIITNYDGNAYSEIALLFPTSLQFWEYNSTNSVMRLKKNVSLVSATGCNAASFLACFRQLSPLYCNVLTLNTQEICNIKIMTNGTSTVRRMASELPYYTHSSAYLRNGISSSVYDTLGYVSAWIPVSTLNTMNSIRYVEINATGNYTGKDTGQLFSQSGSGWYTYYNSANWARLGSSWYLLVRGYLDPNAAASQVYGMAIYNDVLTAQYYPRGGTAQLSVASNASGNWMVSDVDHDGNTDACSLINRTVPPGNPLLACVDDSFSRYSFSIECPKMKYDSAMVMADFFPNNDTMGIANIQGIWQIDNGQCNLVLNSSVVSYAYTNPLRHQGIGIVFRQSSGSSPVYVYTDTSQGFIIRDKTAGDSCGNGICGAYENEITCAADCMNATAQPAGTCITDADCGDQYPTCLFGYCITGNTTTYCTLDVDCPYNYPFCFHNTCIADAALGIGQVTNNTPAAQQEAGFDSVMSILFEGSTMMKFIIGIAIVIGIIIEAAIYIKSGIAVMVVGALGLVLVTVIGLVPMYVLIIMVIIMIGIAILGKTIQSSPGG